jgi:hypothetical protein
MELTDAFWSKVDKTGDCWVWQGTKTTRGYGIKIIDHRSFYTHRLVWEVFNGRPIPEGMEICHRCDNPPCCNPEHLFVGTHNDNMQDAINKRRLNNSGENNGRHKLTLTQVKEIKECYIHTPRGGVSHGKKNSQASLANLYDVTRYAIRAIVNGKSWKKENNDG